jgi:hypothetical protein
LIERKKRTIDMYGNSLAIPWWQIVTIITDEIAMFYCRARADRLIHCINHSLPTILQCILNIPYFLKAYLIKLSSI